MRMLVLGILLGMVARECIGGPVARRDIVKEEDTLTYKGDIADMKTIRRSGKVNNFLEDDHDPRLNASQLLSFMTSYGYIAEGAPNTEALHSEEAISEAVRKMQSYGGVNITGVLDKDTIQLLLKPRCGNKDLRRKHLRRSKRFIVGSKGWKKRRLTYNLSNWTPKLGNREFVAAELDRAFQSWAVYAGLEFVSTDDYHQADIRVAFGRYSHGDLYPFDGPGFVLAHAYYPYEFGDFGGDIHFDEDEDWRMNVTDTWTGMDFFTVAQHEIGHSLGLAHSPVSDSVMYPYYKGKQGNQGVGYDDVLAMYELYIKNTPQDDMEDKDGSDEDYNVGNESPTEEDEGSQYDYVADEGEYYDNDDEDARQPKPTPSTTSTTTTTTTEKTPKEPDDDICKTRMFDSLGHIRNELFVFLGKTMWRFSRRGYLRPGYPAPAAQMFGFPSNIQRIDAVYERMDGNILFFTGNKYWISDGNSFIDGSPRPLSDLGLPRNLSSIDAVFTWGKNKKTYIFAGSQYWRYDEREAVMEEDYPKNIRNWRGVPSHIDGVITWRDGVTYFFKKDKFWRFDDYLVITDSEIPLNTARHWFHC